MSNKLKHIIDRVNQLKVTKKRIIIAIDGRSGSGKTTFVNQLKKNFVNVQVVHLDKFDLYQGAKSFGQVISQVLKTKDKKDISKEILIVEGIFALSRKLRNYYDVKIWIDYPKELGFKRGLERDIALNGINNTEKWVNYWLPKEDLYINRERPQDCADFIVSN